MRGRLATGDEWWRPMNSNFSPLGIGAIVTGTLIGSALLILWFGWLEHRHSHDHGGRMSQARIRARSRREWFLGVLALAGTAAIGESHAAQQGREHTIEALNSSVDLDRQDLSRATVAVTVVNRGSEPDRLDSALSPVAKGVEAHVSG